MAAGAAGVGGVTQWGGDGGRWGPLVSPFISLRCAAFGGLLRDRSAFKTIALSDLSATIWVDLLHFAKIWGQFPAL